MEANQAEGNNDEFQCVEHNVSIVECECDGMYCRHGEWCPDYMVRLTKETNRGKHRLLQRCPCGKYKYESLDELRSDPEKKTPAQGGDDKPGNWYMITLTQPDTDKTIANRIKAAQKILKSKQVSPEQWCYSLELTAKGTPHIHIAVFTYKYPEFRVINKFNDGHRVDIQREKFNVKNYVIKNETKPTEAMLATWGLDSWFYCSANYSGPRPELPAPASPSARITVSD